MNKYCRICWNTEGWQRPTGDARNIETGTFVAKNGFGLEEWLFNYNHILRKDGIEYKYGFLQPLGKYWTTYEKSTFDVLLYVYSPGKNCLLIGEIKNVFVPSLDELTCAFQKMEQSNIVSQMKGNLSHLDIKTQEFDLGDPRHVINIRFTKDDVLIYKTPRKVTDQNHKIIRNKRYVPMDWDDGYPSYV